MRRANQPLDPEAIRKANEALAEKTGGRQLTSSPEDAELRKQWMDSYIAAAGPGSYTSTKQRSKPPAPASDCPTQEENFVELQYCYEDGDYVGGACYEILDGESKSLLASGKLDDEGYCYAPIPFSTNKVLYKLFDNPNVVKIASPPKELYTLTIAGEWLDSMIKHLDDFEDWTWGALQGDFNENPTYGQIFLNTVLTLIPGVDQLGDGRDIIANLKLLVVDQRYDEVIVWFALVATAIGLVPELGSAIKGVLQAILKAIQEGAKLPLTKIIEVVNYFILHGDFTKGDAAKYLKEFGSNLKNYGNSAKSKIKEILDVILEKLNYVILNLSDTYATRARNIRNTIDKLKGQVNGKVDEVMELVRKKLDETFGDAAEDLNKGEIKTINKAKANSSKPPELNPVKKIGLKITSPDPSKFRGHYLNRMLDSTDAEALVEDIATRGKKLGPQLAENLTITPVGKVGGRHVVSIKTVEGKEFIFYRSSGINEKTTGKKIGDWIPIPGWGKAMIDKVLADPWFIKVHGCNERYGVSAFQEIAEILHKEEGLFMNLLKDLD